MWQLDGIIFTFFEFDEEPDEIFKTLLGFKNGGPLFVREHDADTVNIILLSYEKPLTDDQVSEIIPGLFTSDQSWHLRHEYDPGRETLIRKKG